MEVNPVQKGHERSVSQAEVFLEDVLFHDINSVTDDFIAQNLEKANKILENVQNASLYWKEMIDEESISKCLKESFSKYLEKSKYLRIELNKFIKSAELKQKYLLEKSITKEVKTPVMEKKVKAKEIKQVPRCFGTPFGEKKYKIGSILPCENSNYTLYVPAREFKLLAFDGDTSNEKKEIAFVTKLAIFACACINARFNGTIYFGVADKKGAYKHGEIVGMDININDIVQYEEYIDKYFTNKSAKCLRNCSSEEKIAFSACISSLYAIELEESERHVLEVDIHPTFNITKFLKFKINLPNENNSYYYLRMGSSSNKISDDGRKEFVEKTSIQYILRRQDYEETQRGLPRDNNSTLIRLLCNGETKIFYNKYQYFLMINSVCHEPCCEMKGIQDLNWISSIEWKAIFDFNPNTEKNGVLKLLQDCKDVIDKPATITMDLLNEHFNVDLNGRDFLKKYGEKTLHIACCSENEKGLMLFSDWKGYFKPQLKKIFDVLTGPERIQDLSHIKFIVLCCSKEKKKEFLSFLREISMKYEVLKHFSFISQNDEHLKSCLNTIIEEYGEDSTERNLSTLLTENSICLEWNKIDSFVKQNCLEPVEGKYVQSSCGIPIFIKPKVTAKFYSNGLSILASNECQEIEAKQSKEITAMHDLTMKNFLRGKDPSWELYYFVSERSRLALEKVVPDALIERELIKAILNKIEQFKQSGKNCIELVGIGHLPGTGASTVAMHVLWFLKDKYRCLKVVCNEVETYNLEDLAGYVLDFRSLGEKENFVQGEEKIECLPLLILMDNTDNEVAVTFQKKIQNEVSARKIKFKKTLGIILFVHNNKLEPSSSNFNLLEKFTLKEKVQFSAKLEQFKKNVDSDQLQMEDMIGFLIMVNKLVDDNGKEYKNWISDIVSKIAYAMEAYPNERWLLLILAIFKYYAEGNIALSHALILLKYGDYQKDMMEMVCDHFKMLVNIRRDHEEGFGDYNVIEITHCAVAEVLMESFLKSEDKLVVDVLNDMLENKSFLNNKFLRKKFIKDLRVMVVRRKRYEFGNRQNFSSLILELKNKNSTSAVQFLKNVIEKLDSLKLNPKETGVAMIHQTLSRLHLAIHQFEDAKECIYRAIKINNKNFTFYDTAGQIFKKEIMGYCISGETNIDVNKIFILSSSAIKYFKQAQTLYEDQNFNYAKESFLEEDYNYVELFKTAIFPGYFGEIAVNLSIAEKLMGWAKENEKDDVRSFISGKKGFLIRNIAREHNIDLVTHTEWLSKINERTLFCMQAIAKKLDFNSIQDKTKILRSESKRYSEIFSDSCFEKLADKLKSTKTTFETKLNQVKCYFEIFLVESLYCVQGMENKELLNLYNIVKAFKKTIDKEKHDILSLGTSLLVCLLNGNIAKSLEDPIFKFDFACLISKHLTSVSLEKYEIYFWYTVLNWPTAKETKLGSLSSSYDESILEDCLKCLLQIYCSSVTCVRGEKIHSTHKPFYMLQNETGYKKIAIPSNRSSNNEILKGKLIDDSVEYILPLGTMLRIRCAHLRLNRGSRVQEITFELGFTLAGPVAYNCKKVETLKEYNDLQD